MDSEIQLGRRGILWMQFVMNKNQKDKICRQKEMYFHTGSDMSQLGRAQVLGIFHHNNTQECKSCMCCCRLQHENIPLCSWMCSFGYLASFQEFLPA